jgi:hypothetical protein
MTHVRFRLLLASLGPLVWLAVQGCEGGCNQGALSGSAGFPGMGRAGTSGFSTGGVDGGAGVPGVAGAGAIGPSGGAATGGRGSGRGGSSGTGGRSTMTGETCLPVGTPMCPATMCGNNRRDTCVVPSGMGLCPVVTLTEMCDGTDFGGRSCESLGFGSGTLRCLACNEIDTSGCSECRMSDATILRCGVSPVSGMPLEPAIAGTATEVGMAWGELVGGTPVINFGRLTENLDLVSTTRAVMAGVVGATVGSIDVAARPSGWLVTAYVEPSVLLVALDATGKVVQRRAVKVVPLEQYWGGPMFAAQPNGQSIIAWQSEAAVSAALIEPDGSTLTPLPDLARSDAPAFLRGALFANGAFYVALAVETPNNGGQTRLVRITTAGAVETTIDVLPDVDAGEISYVAGAADLRVVYSRFVPSNPPDDGGWSLLWQRLTATGAAATPPVVLGREPQFAGLGRGVGFEDDTVVLLFDVNNLGSLSVTRLASNGSISYQNFGLTVGGVAVHHIDITRRGPDAVALWVNDRGLRLARLAVQSSVR